jgi:hypothetical protein
MQDVRTDHDSRMPCVWQPPVSVSMVIPFEFLEGFVYYLKTRNPGYADVGLLE